MTMMIVAILTAIGLAVLLGVLGVAGGATPPQPEICTDSETREKIRALAMHGIDDAFTKHTSLLFEVWVKDAVDQPRRAITGNQANIRAYLRARADVLKWNPQPCP